MNTQKRKIHSPPSTPATDLSRPELVVFACSDDLDHGPIAATWFDLLADPRRVRAIVTTPEGMSRVSPDVVHALRERGGDLSTIRVRTPAPELLQLADLVVTMGETFHRDRVSVPAPARREHWMVPLSPPRGGIESARELRDLIRSRVAMLVFTEGWGRNDISRETARVTLPRHSGDPHPSA